jgi:ABC-type multidrug transport system fused ATPase/permease subunit
MFYTDTVDQEGDSGKVIVTVPQNWPSEGRITGKNIEMKYRDGPLVLKGFDFDILPKEKIGLAGRTG